ncbi:MAG: hypothetical protein K2G45_11275 [Lachnospiraceae bacterium]|nr:hypothetical protein [Lachnospiraceae bacterium]
MAAEQNEVGASSEENGFWCKLTEVEVIETRGYARNFSYTYEIYYISGNNTYYICTYTINLTYSYTDSKAIISNFKYTKGNVTSGYTVTGSTSTSNGNPGYANLTVKVKENRTGYSMTEVVQFKCKISGNVDIYSYRY